MAVFNGNDLVLSIGTTNSNEAAFAHSSSASISFSNALVDTTTKSSDSWDEMISGRRSWTISSDGLVDFETVTNHVNFPTFTGYALAGTKVFLEFDFGGDGWTGEGFIESFEASGASDEAVTYSVSIKGTGALTAVTA